MFFGRVILFFAAGVGSLRYGLGLYAWRISNKLEKPAYEIIGRLGKGVELRRYGGYTTAEVNFVHPESMRAATSQGFKKVAGFIFGKNRNRGSRLSQPSEGRGAAMAMTAPVRINMEGPTSQPEKVTISFVMGANYTTKTLPVPLDRDVKIQTVPPHVMAAVSFSGPPPSEAVVDQKRRIIESEIAKAGTGIIRLRSGRSNTLVYGYHDPFMTPNLLRKNEVGIIVDAA